MRAFTLLIAGSILLISPQITVAQDVTVAKSGDIVSLSKGNYYIHTVKRRETIYGIVKAYGIDAQTLVDENPKIRTEGLQPRQTLMIPTLETYQRIKSLQPPVVEKVTKNVKPAATPAAIPETTAEGVNVVIPQHATPALPEAPIAVPAPVEVAPVTGGNPSRVAAPMADEPLRIALLLPFGGTSAMNENAADFYSGALMAIDELRTAENANIELNVYSTGGSEDKTTSLLENSILRPHLIIGPVYPEPFAVAAKWASQNSVPIVSPLTTVDDAVSQANPFVIQVPPPSENKYDKIRSLITPSTNVVLVVPEVGVDSAALTEMRTLLPASHVEVLYNRASGATKVKEKLLTDQANLVLIPTSHQGTVEEVLSRLAALNSLVKRYDMTIVGTPRWRTLNNVNAELFFRTQTIYPTSYYSDRMSEQSGAIYRDFMKNFSRVPSPIALRGYDMIKLFYGAFKEHGPHVLKALGSDNAIVTPAQTPYLFENFNGDGSMKLNRQWVLVQHNADFSISTK